MRLRRRRGYISSPEEMLIPKAPSGYAPGVAVSSGSTAGTWSVDGGPAIPYNATPAEAEQIDPELPAKLARIWNF